MRLCLVKALALQPDRIDELLVLGVRQLVGDRGDETLHERDRFRERELVTPSQLAQPRVIPLGFLAVVIKRSKGRKTGIGIVIEITADRC